MVFRRDDCHRLVQIPLRTMKDRQGDASRRFFSCTRELPEDRALSFSHISIGVQTGSQERS
ncbi:hypothetical protein HMPREF9374_3733 [Desmospora sp. 8437]|nr:hypothetical protein HMPREF9374_3733 [Desmospora sp. 8437]